MNKIDWEKLKESYSLEDFYNILYRNKPHKNNKIYPKWDYLESIAYEELLDEIIEFLKEQRKEVKL